MEVVGLIAKKLHVLPPDKQREVRDFVDSLSQRVAPPRGRRDPRGLWVDLEIDLTARDVDDARRELWGTFPREDI